MPQSSRKEVRDLSHLAQEVNTRRGDTACSEILDFSHLMTATGSSPLHSSLASIDAEGVTTLSED